MGALDLRHIDEAGSAADERAAREIEPRDRLKAALVQRSRTIGNASSAFKERTNRRVGFKTLKFFKRIEERVAVIEPDDKPDCNLAIFEMVEERAAIGLRVEWPAD